MKKIKLYIASLFVFLCLSNSNAHAFFLITPVTPTLDGVTDAVQGVLNFANKSLGMEVKSVKNGLDLVNDVKGKVVKNSGTVCFVDCADAASGKELPKAVKTGKDIEQSKLADVSDPESVKKAIYNLFFVSPSGVVSENACYREQAKKFYRDNIVEIYTTTLYLEEELKVLHQRLAELEVTLQEGGEDGVDEVDNTITALENSYQAYEIRDQLLRVYQELKAMEVQYEIAIAINGNVIPVKKKEAKFIKENKKSDKVSFIFNEGGHIGSSASLMAFAQVSSNEDYNLLETKDAPDANISSPFDGNEDNLKALEEVAKLSVELDESLSAHNVSSALDSFKTIFVAYERFVRLHNKSLEMLNRSDQCVINYMGNYYKNPEAVWSGGYLGNLTNQHELRKGVSRWLIDSYEVAKSQMVTPLTAEELGTPLINSKADYKNVPSIEAAKSSKNEGVMPINTIKEKRSTDIGRFNDTIPWAIGSEVALSLGKDQFGAKKWGETTSQYPLWGDQKSYYRQYIEGKYNNIAVYLEQLDTRPAEMRIAREFNKLNNDNIIKQQETFAKSKNEKWLTSLTTATQSAPKNTVEDEELEWFALTEQKVGGIVLDINILNKREEQLKLRKKQLQDMSIKTEQILREIDNINKELADIVANKSWLNAYKEDLTTVVKTEGWLGDTANSLAPIQEAEASERLALGSDLSSIIQKYDNSLADKKTAKEKALATKEKRLSDLSFKLEEAENLLNLYTRSINSYSETELEVREKFASEEEIDSVSKANLEKKVPPQKTVIERLNAEAKVVIADIEKIHKDFEIEFAKAERSLAIAMRNVVDREADVFKEFLPLSDIYKNNVLPSISSGDSKYSGSIVGFFTHASTILGEVRNYAVEETLKTMNGILASGDKIYYQEGVSDVVKKHKILIDGLKEISPEKLIAFSNIINSTYKGYASILNVASTAYNAAMVDSICKDDSCYSSDDLYFVGLYAKERDFKAPKEAINEYMPALREVFYFDEIDYASLYNKNNYVEVKIPYEAGSGFIGKKLAKFGGIFKSPSFYVVKRYYVSKNGIINYGGFVPEVWRLALSGKAFVERDIDLERFFGREDDEKNHSTTEFFRGGRYPCRLDGNVIDIDKNANFIIAKPSTDRLPTCQEVALDKKYSYYNIRDIEEDISTAIGNGESSPREYPSELGKIFYWADDYVLYKETVESTFKRLAEIEKAQREDKKYNASVKDEIYHNALLNKNQLGDFLSIVELETTYRQAKEKMKLSVDEAKELLFAELRKVGFEPNPNLNLAKEADYNLVKKSLKNRKLKVLNEVVPKIRGLATNTNEVVAERLENLDKLSKALQKDSDELLALSQSVPNLNDLDEDLKSERANLKAKEKHDKEAEDAIEKELKRMTRPYCASY